MSQHAGVGVNTSTSFVATSDGRSQRRHAALYALIAFALIKPDSLSHIGLEWLDLLLMGVDVGVLLYLVGMFVSGNLRLSSITITVSLYFLALVPSTLLGSLNFGLFTRMAGPAVAACMLTDYAVSRHPRSFLDGMTWGLMIAYAANFISIVMFYPEGMYSTERISGDLYLMGFDNGMIYGLLPLAVYALTRSLVKHSRLTTPSAVAAITLMFASVIYVAAVSGIIGAACFVLLLMICAGGRIGSVARLSLFMAWLSSAILIVATRHMQLIPAEFTSMFDKDETLTGRTELWDYALTEAAKHPFLGVGLGQWVPGAAGHFYPHPHSMLVDAIYTGGLLAAAALTAVILAVMQAAVRGPSSWVHAVIMSGVLSLLIVEIANSTQFKALFWAILALLAHSDRLTRLVTCKPINDPLAGVPPKRPLSKYSIRRTAASPPSLSAQTRQRAELLLGTADISSFQHTSNYSRRHQPQT